MPQCSSQFSCLIPMLVHKREYRHLLLAPVAVLHVTMYDLSFIMLITHLASPIPLLFPCRISHHLLSGIPSV